MYLLSMFNTGQITLPKKWREKFKTNKFIAEEVAEGLLIKPVVNDEVVYYENEKGYGVYCEKGMDPKKIIDAINKIDGQDK